MEPELTERLGHLRVGQRHHPALPGGHVLVGVEAEARGRTVAAHPHAVHLGPDGVGGVFHDRQTVAIRNLAQGLHVTGEPSEVDRHESPGPGPDRRLDPARVHVERPPVHVHQERPGTGGQDGVHRGGEGQGRSDHLVSGSHAVGQKGELEGGGARREGNGMLRPHIPGERIFELGGPWAEPDPS